MAHGMPRPDVFQLVHGSGERVRGEAATPGAVDDPHGHSYRSGFWGFVRLAPSSDDGPVEVRLRAVLASGEEPEVSLGRVQLRSRAAPDAPTAGNGSLPSAPRVAICMATYNPPGELLRRQIDSIRSQTHDDWICLISDDCSKPAHFAAVESAIAGDPRFVVSRSPRRLGFYHNFERALEMAPAEASFVALCDQDDRWHPDKLETLLGAIGNARLVYSDSRIVAPDGSVVANTYWSRRRNNHTNLASLLMANTVTGAAALFRRDVLDIALPFPPRHGIPYHDHWLALVALAAGRIAYVDRPLYDYVQHGSAALGHEQANRGAGGLRTFPDRLRKLARAPRSLLGSWRSIYFWDVCRIMLFAAVLDLRLGDRIGRRKGWAVHRMLSGDRSPLTIAWLALRRLRRIAGRNETLGAEGTLLRGMAWRAAVTLIARRSERAGGPLRGNASLPAPPNAPARTAIAHPGTRTLSEKVRPLELDERADAPERVNLLIPTIDLDHFFGGYIAKLNLARRLAESGMAVRVVTVDPTPPLPRSWRRRLESFSGLSGALDRVEVAFGREGGPLEVNPRDRFIASTWWTAHVADAALSSLERERFLYLIQEYEPFTFPMGSLAAVASGSYELPHFALFSTELLRGYFRGNGLGVFAAGEEIGDRDSLAFENAITRVRAPSVHELVARRTRRLLFYARPEPHAARNMFELGALGLATALADGAVEAGWELHGIGAVEGESTIDLGGGAELRVTARRDQAAYARLLAEHDVGLALMYTPHPSLVPIEMSSAAMLTVTNRYANKSAEAMAAISENLITVEPSVEGIVGGLRAATQAVGDHERRVRGSDVRWSRDWDTSFDDQLVRRVSSFLEAS